MTYFLGVDCGGTFIKAAIFDQTGKILACERENVAVISSQAGYAERDMATLWQACASVIKQSIQASGLNANEIKAVAISAQGKGAFLLDKQNQPLGNAILSSDQRSAEIVKKWQQQSIAEQVYARSYQGLWTGHPVAILRWLKENQPERYQKIGSVLMSHDYLRFCLTGELHCEESNISESNLYNMQTAQYDSQLAEIFGIGEILDKLPPIIKANQIAGYVTEQAAAQCGLAVGTPVAGGVFDVTAMTLCINDQNAHNKLNVILGTWSIVTGISNSLTQHSNLAFAHGKYPDGNKFLLQEASPTSAGNLEWFAQQWKLSYAEINQMISELEPANTDVLFVPFLYGSNAKMGMTAGFYGIQSHHNQAHLLQAVYEGVLFSLMYHLQRMEQKFTAVDCLRVTGGFVKSPVWIQMLADLTGKQLEIPEIEEIGCLGAACMAAESVGVSRDQFLANQSLKRIQPNPQYFAAYQAKYAKYQKWIELLGKLTD